MRGISLEWASKGKELGCFLLHPKASTGPHEACQVSPRVWKHSEMGSESIIRNLMG